MGKGIFLFIGVASLSASAIFVRLANAPASITAFYRLFFTFILIFPLTILKKSNREELKSLNKKDIILCIISGFSALFSMVSIFKFYIGCKFYSNCDFTAFIFFNIRIFYF